MGFGGKGPSPVDYLNEHGDFILNSSFSGINNQLFCYCPTTQTWTNVKCYGDVPSPRLDAATANIQDDVWLCGGTTQNNSHSYDLYELNMLSLVWTKIETAMPRPHATAGASLTPISASQLVLVYYDGLPRTLPRSWVFDIQTRTWKQHSSDDISDDILGTSFIGITGLNNNVTILERKIYIEGYLKGSQHHMETITFSVMLEPKCLQQLAIQMIYKHKSKLPCEILPEKLTRIIMGNE